MKDESFHPLHSFIFVLLERAAGIGRLGISYGVGMVLGPLVGGFVTERFSEQTAAVTAALGSLVSVALVFLFIPTNTKALLIQPVDTDKKGEVLVFFLFCILHCFWFWFFSTTDKVEYGFSVFYCSL